MSGKVYLKNRLPAILVNLLGMTALALFLMAGGTGLSGIVLILTVWLLVLAGYFTVSYVAQKRYLDHLLEMTRNLKERYLIPEIMGEPQLADQQVFYRIMKMAEKSMLEEIEAVQRERKEYREYIEQWIHEVKTPITAIRLLCENHRSDTSRELLAELEHINRYTEQALYYARSEETQRDYLIRETPLGDVIHGAVADNKYLLRRHQVKVEVEDAGICACTDDKWLRFLLDQLISNAIKYRGSEPKLRFVAGERQGRVFLAVEDNGIGIPESDLPRIFDKGFTGTNGRLQKSSTGIGLYLCRKLCDKLGIDLTAESGGRGKGTRMELTFPVDDFIAEVQEK